MAFTDGPQAHHEASVARTQVALVRVGHDRGVAERRALDRVLLGEVGADQPASSGRQLGRVLDPVRDQLEVLIQGGAEIGVPARERGHDLGQRRRRLVVIELQHPLDDRAGPGLALDRTLLTRDEQLGQHSTRVGPQPLAAAANLDGCRRPHDCTSARACCSVAIMANVDSAPWFSFRASAWRPSQPPPVEGS